MPTLGFLSGTNESMKVMFLTECFAKSNAQGELISTPTTNKGKKSLVEIITHIIHTQILKFY